MAMRNYKATSPAKRHMSVADFSGLTDKKPEKKLSKRKAKNSGRNNKGRITVRRRGGGNKQKLRNIDWRRDKEDVPAKVVAFEYDPNRSAHLSLLQYKDGEKRYILQAEKQKIGDIVVSGKDAEIRPGNSKKLKDIPLGTVVHNIELRPGSGAQLVKTAGAGAQLIAKEGKYVSVKLPSGETRLILNECKATVGRVGNSEHENEVIGKAGKNRHRGRRPKVRGVAMNPVDHPHGGGEGKSPVGLPSPVTPWGQPTRGYKTRRKNKKTNKYIVRERNRR